MDNDSPASADLIVVLGGDFWGARVDKGAELGVKRYAPQVLISGPPYGSPPRPEAEFAIERMQTKGYPRELFISFGHLAKSTPDEVIALCTELGRRNARSILLVTDPYHSRRAHLTFYVLCPGVKCRSVPATETRYQSSRWWTRDADRSLVKSEWTKMLGTILLAPKYWLDKVNARVP